MITLLVETKKEYMIQLNNILAPLIYEGLQSIYKDSTKGNNSLNSFQIGLKAVPKWTQDTIDKESNRILNFSKSCTYLEDLLKATVKANIIVLTYNTSLQNQHKIDPTYYKDIKFNDFIHKCYIECARQLWNNPFLFYHEYPPIELKRNQRDSIILIKECIAEAIRKLLPLKHILEMYLGEELEIDNNQELDRYISDVEQRNLKKMIDIDLNVPVDKPMPVSENIYKDFINTEFKKTEEIKKMSDIKKTDEKQHGGNKMSSDKTIGSQILHIINDQPIKLTDKSSTKKRLSKISETSVMSKNENNDFQEKYSNGNKNQSDIFTKNLANNNKSKFFANYLNY